MHFSISIAVCFPLIHLFLPFAVCIEVAETGYVSQASLPFSWLLVVLLCRQQLFNTSACHFLCQLSANALLTGSSVRNKGQSVHFFFLSQLLRLLAVSKLNQNYANNRQALPLPQAKQSYNRGSQSVHLEHIDYENI